MKKIVLLVLVLIVSFKVSAQINPLIIPSGIFLPKDSLVKNQLITDLNGFLAQKEKPNKENTFILKQDLLETSILLDEIKEIERSKKFNDDNFYKGYLTNVLRLSDSIFKIQFVYMGVNDSIPLLKANFSIIATKKNGQFYFNSPLKMNTATWKIIKFGNAVVYYKNKLNSKSANDYFDLTEKFDKKLNAPIIPTEYYCGDNFNEVLQLIGVDYKIDYNGNVYNSLNANENNTNLILNGTLTSDFTGFDPHDLWHSRLHNVLSTSIINKPVDEGTAYLYGGSWGLTWKEILTKFKLYVAQNPKADWINLYNESTNFDPTAKYPLNVDMVINALLIKKIESEKGFPAVIELLSCGKKVKDNSNYFLALEKITGIKKADFNDNVWKLVRSY